MKKFTADFETAVWLEDETWVWAWATCEIGNEKNLQIGNNIDSFIEYCKNEKNSIFYFHSKLVQIHKEMIQALKSNKHFQILFTFLRLDFNA